MAFELNHDNILLSSDIICGWEAAFELLIRETPDVFGLWCGTGLNVETPSLYHIKAHCQDVDACENTPSKTNCMAWVLICQFRLMETQSCLVVVVQANSVVQGHTRKYDKL